MWIAEHAFRIRRERYLAERRGCFPGRLYGCSRLLPNWVRAFPLPLGPPDERADLAGFANVRTTSKYPREILLVRSTSTGGAETAAATLLGVRTIERIAAAHLSAINMSRSAARGCSWALCPTYKVGVWRRPLAPTFPSMSDNRVLYAASLCAAASAIALVLRWQRNGGRLPYPPGPRGYPLIGNVLDVPRDTPIWKAFISIAQKYSTCLTLAGVCPRLKTLRP